MSEINKGQSTGPKTVEGKAKSSQNARKDSIFVKGYLPWENLEAKREEFEAMIKQWRAKDPTRLMLIRTVEQSILTLERIMYAQARRVEGVMQSITIAREFCERAGMTILAAGALPYWFFMDAGSNEKDRAIFIAQLYDEASSFKSNYSDQLAARVKDEYPRLYKRVMQGQKEGASFLGVLGTQYKQSTPIMNLASLMNDLKDKYPHHFTWAGDSVRYQKIIDGLRAEQMELAMDLDKTNRHATSIQNRIDKAIATLAKLDLHESQLRNQLTLQSKVIEDEKLSSSELKGSELELIQSS